MRRKASKERVVQRYLVSSRRRVPSVQVPEGGLFSFGDKRPPVFQKSSGSLVATAHAGDKIVGIYQVAKKTGRKHPLGEVYLDYNQEKVRYHEPHRWKAIARHRRDYEYLEDEAVKWLRSKGLIYSEKPEYDTRSQASQAKELSPGDRVKHSRFGIGEVLEVINHPRGGPLVVVDFGGSPSKVAPKFLTRI